MTTIRTEVEGRHLIPAYPAGGKVFLLSLSQRNLRRSTLCWVQRTFALRSRPLFPRNGTEITKLGFKNSRTISLNGRPVSSWS